MVELLSSNGSTSEMSRLTRVEVGNVTSSREVAISFAALGVWRFWRAASCSRLSMRPR